MRRHKCEKLKGYVETMTLKGKTEWYYWNKDRNWANTTKRCPICLAWLPKPSLINVKVEIVE